jgi:hypothetical protein
MENRHRVGSGMNGRDQLMVLKPRNYGAPGEIIRAARSPLRGRRPKAAGDQLGRRRPSCRTPDLLVRREKVARNLSII